MAELLESSGGTIRFRARPFLCMWDFAKFNSNTSLGLTQTSFYSKSAVGGATTSCLSLDLLFGAAKLSKQYEAPDFLHKIVEESRHFLGGAGAGAPLHVARHFLGAAGRLALMLSGMGIH